MPRKSKHRIPEEKLEIMKKIIEGYNVQTTADLQEALKDLLGGTIQTMLEEELDCQIMEREAEIRHTTIRGTDTSQRRSGAAWERYQSKCRKIETATSSR